MASASMANRRERQGIWMPFLVSGYLETLRRATFYAFGWEGLGQALGVMGLLVAVLTCAQYCCPSRRLKRMSVTAVLGFLSAVWFFNSINAPGKLPLSLDLFFGLPNFGLGDIKPVYYATFCVLVLLLYGMIIFLLTGFVLERKVIAEIFFAGTILVVVEVISVDAGIMGYVILNAFFGIVLKSQIHFVHLESDPRVRFSAGSGFQLVRWAWTAMAVGAVVIFGAMVLPAGQSKADVSTLGQKLIEKVLNKSTLEGAGSRFNLFWGEMQSFTLTGKVPTEDITVMRVKSSRPSYWRGESADVYTGKGWQNYNKARVVLEKEFANPYSEKVKVDLIEQTFSFSSIMSSQVVFTSGPPASMQVHGTLTVDDGDNFYTTAVKKGAVYKITSYVPERDPAELRRSGYNYPESVTSRYLQLPGTTPLRVHRLAEELTKDAQTPYDKVKIIEKFLSTNYPYDLSIAPVPENRDVVDYFLFDLKKGYCTYHSTAMVVMLRTLGIPARWVKGFTTGVFDPVTGAYEVKMKDAHAWVEVYFADYGWLPFEPTSSFVLPETEQVKEAEVVEAPPEPSGNRPQESAYPKVSNGQKGLAWGAVITVVLLVLAGTAFYFRSARILGFGPGDKIRDIYISLINLLAYKGYPKDDFQTPLEFARRLKEPFPAEYADIVCVTNAYLRDRYGPRRLSSAEIKEARAALKRLADKWLGKTRD